MMYLNHLVGYLAKQLAAASEIWSIHPQCIIHKLAAHHLSAAAVLVFAVAYVIT